MNVLVVDTSSWISYFKGKPNTVLDLALKEGRVFVSPIVVSELLSAQLSTDKRNKLIGFLKELPLYESSFEHWVKVGELRAKCSKKGLHLSTPDAHIAQCALELEGYLLSEDLIFQKLMKLVPLKWLE